MQGNKLHIVCFDVPYPPDYGGAVDLFYKIKSLSAAGCEIYLHCYEYGRGRKAELEQYCSEVNYYQRSSGIKGLSFSLPYIVSSRRDNDLLKQLQEIDAPILFEGVHTTFFLSHPSLSNRFKAIRTHNTENEYYRQLAEKETGLLKKTYYSIEATLLKKYESTLQSANAFFCLSLTDHEYFRRLYPSASNCYIPPFHPYDKVTTITGTGNYCLYHGNLSHPENREAVFFLLKDILPYANAQFIIAGKNPPAGMIKKCNSLSNCTLIPDPDKKTIDDLIARAHIHVLPTFQQSGMKLKLLAALFGGRHVLANPQMLYGTNLEAACHIWMNRGELISKIDELMQQPFTEQDKQHRIQQLLPYDKAANAQLLMSEIR